MNPRCCSQNHWRLGAEARPQKSGVIQARKALGVIVPGTLLTLMPKCPICLAAYVALGTGFTLSAGSAHILMRVLTALCIGTLALCAAWCLITCWRQKQVCNLQPNQTRS